MTSVLFRLTAGIAVGALFAAGVPSPGLAATSAADLRDAAIPAAATAEQQQTDRIKTPALHWYACYDGAECSVAHLPLDYAHPAGPTVEVGVLRVKAKDQKHKIGSLFVNPGGPGGSATQFAYVADSFLSQSVRDKYDVVGVDPRGIGASERTKCFPTTEAQTKAWAGFDVAFPWGKKQEDASIASAKAFGKGCSTTGRRLVSSVSTAEVVRDMEMIRRGVGDPKLSYLGFSYGTAIGQYYANMYPNRVRAIAVDGVINPIDWTGVAAPTLIGENRMHSADGAYKALHELLKRCAKAGEKYCEFGAGDPVKKFADVAKKLQAKPLKYQDDDGYWWTITYADFVGGVLASLYSPDAGDLVANIANETWHLLFASTAAQRSAARAALTRRIKTGEGLRRPLAPRRDFDYNSEYEAAAAVTCTDGKFPKDAAQWRAQAAAADRRAPYLGRIWAWTDAPCATGTWTAHDVNAYFGPFNRRTSAPILVVGSTWDPATNYASAVAVSKLLPNSRLLSSDNWGHTAYGTSACVTDAIDAYLLKGTLPKAGTRCKGDNQPFTEPVELFSAQSRQKPIERLPPVGPALPISILNGPR